MKKEWRRDGRENDELPRSAHAASVDVGPTDCAQIAVCHYRSSELPRDVLLRARDMDVAFYDGAPATATSPAILSV